MKIKPFVAALIVVVLAWLLTANALAMSSTNYRLDWLVPNSGSGGGQSSSPSYAVNFTVGQVAAGSASSTHYQAGLGFWYITIAQYVIELPLVLRSP